jgi:Arc/MetJ family transcription regulator
MRTTVDLDEALVKKAIEVTKIATMTSLLEEGLRAVLRREAGRRLIARGGSDPTATAGMRRRAAE